MGVTSKDVLTKCRAEGIEVKNHMSAVSAGLAATIGEWFSESAVGTAVETTQHVDLTAARRKAAAQRKRRKKAKEELAEAAPAEVVAEAPAVQAVAEAPAPAEAPAVAAEAPAPPVEEAAPPAEEAPPEAAPPAEIELERPMAVPNVPERPEIIEPAGPQVVPKPAKLHGPQVVRF